MSFIRSILDDTRYSTDNDVRFAYISCMTVFRIGLTNSYLSLIFIPCHCGVQFHYRAKPDPIAHFVYLTYLLNCPQAFTGIGLLATAQIHWCSFKKNSTTSLATRWTHIDNVIRLRNHIKIMLNHNHSVSPVY